MSSESDDSKDNINKNSQKEQLPQTVTKKMAGFVSNIRSFNNEEDDLSEYLDMMKHVFIVNEVSSEKKISCLMTLGGLELAKTVNTITKPLSLDSFTYESLTVKLLEYYKPTKNVRAERYKFMSRSMKEDESLSEFIVDLKYLASTCNYDNFLNQILSDKFIWSLKDPGMQKHLIDEPLTKSFEEICAKALAYEIVSKEIKGIQGELVNSGAQANWINRYSKGNNKLSKSDLRRKILRDQSYEEKVICYRCQQFGHKANECINKKVPRNMSSSRYDTRGAKSSYSRNYYPKKDFSKKYRNDDGNFKRGRINAIQAIESEDEASNSGSYQGSSSENEERILMNNLSMGRTKKGKLVQALIFPIIMNGNIINMEIDTGACYTVMSSKLFSKIFGRDCKLSRAFVNELTVLSGARVQVMGQYKVNVQKTDNDTKKVLDLLIVNSEVNYIPLMGRDWIDVLFPNWQLFFNSENSYKLNKVQNFTELVKQKYSDVFNENYSHHIKHFNAQIHLQEMARPIFCGPYTVAYGIREKVDNEIDRLLACGILNKVKFSDWASPMVVVQKKNGEVRLCIDCRVTINKFIKTDHYPIPLIEDLLTEFEGCNWFSIIDLTGAFSQIRISEKSQEYLTMNTHRGLLRYTRLPFGIKSAPAIFQSVVDTILRGTSRARSYMDDILIGGRNMKECEENTALVLKKLSEFNVKANFKKCSFIKKELEYLGFVISGEGIKPIKDKLIALRKAPTPKDVTSLKSYLGLLNFYGRFMRNLSATVAPLYSLTQPKKSFIWNDEHDKCFEASKNLITENNILVHYSSSKLLGIVCDASSYGVGAVLFHIVDGKELPIKFVSATLSEAEKKYSQIEKEALAIVFAFRKFHKFVYGRHVKLFSDHKPLEFIFGEKKINAVSGARIQRWSLLLSQYDYKIFYRKGSQMGNADGLSRLPLHKKTKISDNFINFSSIIGDMPINQTALAEATADDEKLVLIGDYIRKGTWPKVLQSTLERKLFNERYHLTLNNGCLYLRNRLICPSNYKESLLALLQHTGIVRMKSKARGSVWWPGIDRDIEQFVSSCEQCQAVESKGGKSHKISWPNTSRPFERVHGDFFRAAR